MERIKKRHGGQMDMLHGSLADKIVMFALPLAASSILQQLFNAADVAVVGRFAGNQALAGRGKKKRYRRRYIRSLRWRLSAG